MEKVYQKKLFEKVINRGLCSGCGTCAGVCAKGCIDFKNQNSYTPNFDPASCVDCGLCYKVCPSAGFRFESLKASESDWNEAIGSYISFINSNATDACLRKNGASGGTVSAIFKYLLDKKHVDKVVCVWQDKGDFAVLITDDTDILPKTQGSKYIPIPLNTALSEILKNQWTVAVVGTPCQLQGIEKAVRNIPRLKEYIKYKIGLFCGFIQSKNALAAIRRYLKVEAPAWRFDGWRCGEYPGFVKFTNQNTGETRKLLIYDALNMLVPFYSLEKCFMCPDGTNMCADFSFGDIHSRGDNKNCGIIRTVNGAKLIGNMIRDGYLETEQITLEQAMKSTVGSVSYLKGMRALLYIKTNKKAVPEYDIHFNKTKYKKALILQNRVQMFLYRLARKKPVLRFFEKHPKFQMKAGRYIYAFPNYSFAYKILRKIVKR